MLSHAHSPGFIEPCLPSPGEQPPTGPSWVHEIKHDGYRLMARRDALSIGIRLLTSVIEAWVGKRWCPVAQSDYEASARRLFNQASYVCPVETLLRLRRGSDVLIKMPADGRGNVRE